ncbi:MAG: GntR family transcriptional regulator [Clostridiales Family XIII bacterium]|nr:GntR family transcriptional regulator [Clostridiales Family XIII bacterium]
MLLTIRPDDGVAIYLQLRDQIVDGIAKGTLRPGDPLPSVRQLAADLGINLHTVNKAYALLRDEGHVKMLGRKGAKVASPPEADAEFLKEIEASLEKLITEATARGVSPKTILAITENLTQLTKKGGTL